MKRRNLLFILAAEAILCIVVTIAQQDPVIAAESILTFPFGWIGAGLGMLAKLGRLGNAAALLLCTAAAVLPIMYFFARRRYKNNASEVLLLIAGAGIFAAIYFSANPLLLHDIGNSAGETVVRGMLNMFVLSVLICYAVLCVLEITRKGTLNRLKFYLKYLLAAAAVVYVYQAFAAVPQSTIAKIASFREMNTMGDTGASIPFLVLRGIVSAVPWVLNIYTVVLLIGLVEGYGTEAAPQLAEKTQKWCAKTLVITLVSLMLCNLLQIIFCSVIRDVSIVAELPIFSVLFTLAVLLLSRIIRENTRLKQENDLFI